MLCKIVCIMEMNDPLLMRLHNILWKKKTLRNILTYLSCHIVSLYTVNGWILVGILLFYFLVVALKQTKNLLVCGIGFTNQRPFITIGNIITRNCKGSLIHQLVLHHILNLLHTWGTLHILTGILNICSDLFNLLIGKLLIINHGSICLINGIYNL